MLVNFLLISFCRAPKAAALLTKLDHCVFSQLDFSDSDFIGSAFGVPVVSLGVVCLNMSYCVCASAGADTEQSDTDEEFSERAVNLCVLELDTVQITFVFLTHDKHRQVRSID